MQEGRSERVRVKASETARSRLPPMDIAKDTKAPMLPSDDSHRDVHAAGTVTVILFVL